MEEFAVGPDVERGERIMWVVDGGVWKSSQMAEGEEEEGLLISEVVVPGFDYRDHEFMSWDQLVEVVGAERAEAWRRLVRE